MSTLRSEEHRLESQNRLVQTDFVWLALSVLRVTD